jgi:hypothetical protein
MSTSRALDRRLGEAPEREPGRAVRRGHESEEQGGTTMSASLRSSRTNAVLWVAQGLLAVLFGFAGGVKLAMPYAALDGQAGLPGWFYRFIAVAELAGALGLILPGALRIRPRLTAWAGAGLVVIMSGATALTALGGKVAPALFPAVVGLVAALVAAGRWSWSPSAARGRAGSHPAAI